MLSASLSTSFSLCGSHWVKSDIVHIFEGNVSTLRVGLTCAEQMHQISIEVWNDFFFQPVTPHPMRVNKKMLLYVLNMEHPLMYHVICTKFTYNSQLCRYVLHIEQLIAQHSDYVTTSDHHSVCSVFSLPL